MRLGCLLALGLACSAPPPPRPLHHVSSLRSEPVAMPAVHGVDGAFPLPHGGEPVGCEECHLINARMEYRLSANCSAARMCHNDVHDGTLGTTCTMCHVPRMWDAVRFDHAEPFPAGGRFPLRGKHAEVGCGKCHDSAADFRTNTTCVGCHGADDVHHGARGADCERCHLETAWR